MSQQESIIIRNFGPIKEVVLEDIKPMCVIIGPSGIGKSSIMKVLSLFRWLYKMENIRSYMRLSGLTKSPFRLRIETHIKSNRFKSYISPNTEIIYRFKGVEISYKNNKLYTPKGAIEPHNLHLEKISFISDNRIAISSLVSGKTKTENFYLKETWEDFVKAFDRLDSYCPSYFKGLKIARTKTTIGYRYRVIGEGYSTALESVSSGTQTAIPMMAICRYFSEAFDLQEAMNDAILRYVLNSDRLINFKPVQNIGEIKSRRVSLHIEEPELSLSPEKQRMLLNELVATCFTQRTTKDKYDVSLMFTTHSPYLLNQLNLLLRAGELGKTIDGAALSYDDLDVYRLRGDGVLYSLKSTNGVFIDTMTLSDDINEIYDEYDRLEERDIR